MTNVSSQRKMVLIFLSLVLLAGGTFIIFELSEELPLLKLVSILLIVGALAFSQWLVGKLWFDPKEKPGEYKVVQWALILGSIFLMIAVFRIM